MQRIELIQRLVLLEGELGRVLFEDGRERSLTSAPTLLLRCLAMAAGRTVPIRELLDLRPAGAKPNRSQTARAKRNRLDTNLRELRNVLEDGDKTVVVTEGRASSLGYRLQLLLPPARFRPPQKLDTPLTLAATRKIRAHLATGATIWVTGPPGSGRSQAILRALTASKSGPSLWVDSADPEQLQQARQIAGALGEGTVISTISESAAVEARENGPRQVYRAWATVVRSQAVRMEPVEEDAARVLFDLSEQRPFLYDDINALIGITGGLPALLERARSLLEQGHVTAGDIVTNADLVHELRDTAALLTDADPEGHERQRAWRGYLSHLKVRSDPIQWSVLVHLRWLAGGVVSQALLASCLSLKRPELVPALTTLAENGILHIRNDQVVLNQDLIHALHESDDSDSGSEAVEAAVLAAARKTTALTMQALELEPHVRKLIARIRYRDPDDRAGLEALLWRIRFLRKWSPGIDLATIADEVLRRLRSTVDHTEADGRRLLAQAIIEAGCVHRPAVDAPSPDLALEAVALLQSTPEATPGELAAAHGNASLRLHVVHDPRAAHHAATALHLSKKDARIPRHQRATYLLEAASTRLVLGCLVTALEAAEQAVLSMRKDQVEAQGLLQRLMTRRLGYALVTRGNVSYESESYLDARAHYDEAVALLTHLSRGERETIYLAALTSRAAAEAQRGVADPDTIQLLHRECVALQQELLRAPRKRVVLAATLDALALSQELQRTGGGVVTHQRARSETLECGKLGLEGTLSAAEQIDSNAELFRLKTVSNGEDDAFACWLREARANVEDTLRGPPVNESMD